MSVVLHLGCECLRRRRLHPSPFQLRSKLKITEEDHVYYIYIFSFFVVENAKRSTNVL